MWNLEVCLINICQEKVYENEKILSKKYFFKKLLAICFSLTTTIYSGMILVTTTRYAFRKILATLMEYILQGDNYDNQS